MNEILKFLNIIFHFEDLRRLETQLISINLKITLTEFGVYSFNGNKIITTSGGGEYNFFKTKIY